MPVSKPQTSENRIIAHIDMDCFYVQVEQRKQPHLRGLPTAVVQYNSWKGGGLIAVSYEARRFGVKRSMRGDEAKQVCPEIQLVQVPVSRGKADLNTYREAGSEVVSILARRGRCERASIDEVYLDLTSAAETMLAETPPHNLENISQEALNSHILGLSITNQDGSNVQENVQNWLQRSDAHHRDKLLACGVLIVADLRMQVLQETQFTCSAGIAHNKMLAKLASAMFKPAQQTAVPSSSVEELLKSFPIKKMKQLGGKLGSSLQIDLGVNTVGDLLQFSEEKLQEHYGVNTGTWLWNTARGINGEEVEGRLLPKSHGSGKTFPGPQALKTLPSVQHWLNELCEELSERLIADLDQNKRIAGTLTLHARAYMLNDMDSHKKFPSKSCPLRYGPAKIQEDAMNLFQGGLREYMSFSRDMSHGNQHTGWAITALSVSASKIVDIPSGTCSIMKYFSGQSQRCSSLKPSNEIFSIETDSVSISEGECNSISNIAEVQMELSDEMETTAKDDLPVLEPSEQIRQSDSACFHPHSAAPLLGRESCSEDITLLQRKLHTEDSDMTADKAVEQKDKRNKSADKGKSSILRFFRKVDPSHSLKQDYALSSRSIIAQSDSGLPSTSGRSEQNNNELPRASFHAEPNNSVGDNMNQGEEREMWHYHVDDIDPSVLSELPPEIQEEIRAWIHPHKRSLVKRGSSITNYFLPTKNV